MPAGVPEVDVLHLARLARIELTPDEQVTFTAQLDDIVRYARQVQQVDTTGVPPMARNLAPGEHERDDTGRASLGQAEALANAPARSPDGASFRVPPVIG